MVGAYVTEKITIYNNPNRFFQARTVDVLPEEKSVLTLTSDPQLGVGDYFNLTSVTADGTASNWSAAIFQVLNYAVTVVAGTTTYSITFNGTITGETQKMTVYTFNSPPIQQHDNLAQSHNVLGVEVVSVSIVDRESRVVLLGITYDLTGTADQTSYCVDTFSVGPGIGNASNANAGTGATSIQNRTVQFSKLIPFDAARTNAGPFRTVSVITFSDDSTADVNNHFYKNHTIDPNDLDTAVAESKAVSGFVEDGSTGIYTLTTAAFGNFTLVSGLSITLSGFTSTDMNGTHTIITGGTTTFTVSSTTGQTTSSGIATLPAAAASVIPTATFLVPISSLASSYKFTKGNSTPDSGVGQGTTVVTEIIQG